MLLPQQLSKSFVKKAESLESWDLLLTRPNREQADSQETQKTSVARQAGRVVLGKLRDGADMLISLPAASASRAFSKAAAEELGITMLGATTLDDQNQPPTVGRQVENGVALSPAQAKIRDVLALPDGQRISSIDLAGEVLRLAGRYPELVVEQEFLPVAGYPSLQTPEQSPLQSP